MRVDFETWHANRFRPSDVIASPCPQFSFLGTPCCAKPHWIRRVSAGSQRWRWCPLRSAHLPAGLPLLPPELDRLLAGDLLAVLQQRRLPDRHHLPQRHLQGLALAVVAERLEVEHLAAVTDPGLLRRERRAAGTVDDVHSALLRPPPAPNPSGGPCHRSSPGSGW